MLAKRRRNGVRIKEIRSGEAIEVTRVQSRSKTTAEQGTVFREQHHASKDRDRTPCPAPPPRPPARWWVPAAFFVKKGNKGQGKGRQVGKGKTKGKKNLEKQGASGDAGPGTEPQGGTHKRKRKAFKDGSQIRLDNAPTCHDATTGRPGDF